MSDSIGAGYNDDCGPITAKKKAPIGGVDYSHALGRRILARD